jgi:hypothetical protein
MQSLTAKPMAPFYIAGTRALLESNDHMRRNWLKWLRTQ